MIDVLERLDVDWSDLATAHQTTKPLLEELAADKAMLATLLDRARSTPRLMGMCERHRLLDKLVIFEGESGWRLRLHMSTQEHLDRPHDHRFSFTTHILAGGYQHVRHELVGELGSDVPPTIQDDFDAIETNLVAIPRFVTHERQGHIYSLHHTEVHTIYTAPDTVSLFLRGPAEKNRSLVTERDGRLWWRYGVDAEKPERHVRKVMKLEEFDDLAARLQQLGITR
jgi:hypothetical protein